MRNKNHFSQKVLKAISKVTDYIDQHPLEKTSTEELASLAGINRVTLQGGFKYMNGIRMKEYQKRKRIEAACAMLADGELTKKEIAIQCGYNNQNNFSNAFKDVKKVSPTEWQERNGNRKTRKS